MYNYFFENIEKELSLADFLPSIATAPYYFVKNKTIHLNEILVNDNKLKKK